MNIATTSPTCLVAANEISSASTSQAKKSQYAFYIGLNRRVINKEGANTLSYGRAWKKELCSVEKLEAHIAKGHPFMPAIIDPGKGRQKQFCNSAQIIAIDVDNGWTIEEAKAHPFVAVHCALGIESASSRVVSAKNPDGHEKFRLIFVMPFEMKGYTDIGAANEYLAQKLGKDLVDSACKDASRFFFGAKGRESFIYRPKAQLPETFLVEAQDWVMAEQHSAEIQRASGGSSAYGGGDLAETLSDVASALKFIPPYSPGNGTYADLRTMIAGVLNQFKEGGRALLEQWDDGRGDWGPGGFERILNSLQGGTTARPATVGTLFHLAKGYGWVKPKHKKRKLSKDEQERRWLEDCVETLGIEVDVDERLTRKNVWQEIRRLHTLSGEVEIGYFSELPELAEGERRLAVLDGQKGTGKTSNAIASVIGRYKRGIVICSTEGLARDAANKLKIKLYKDGIDEGVDGWYATCIESIHKFSAMTGYEAIVFDEANEDIQRSQDGSLGVNPEGCRKTLSELLPVATEVIVATDTMYTPTVEAVRRLGEFAPNEELVIRKKRPQSKLDLFIYRDLPGQSNSLHNWTRQIIRAIEKGKKVLISCGSQKKARELDRMLRQLFRGRYTGGCLDGQYTPKRMKKEFLGFGKGDQRVGGPDVLPQEKNWHWLIYTPVINAGVSMEKNYWDIQFDYITPFETATAASQRGERYRPGLRGEIKERHVYFSVSGLANHPDTQVFTEEYWKAILMGRKNINSGAVKIAKNLGVKDVVETYQAATKAELSQYKELPKYWAIGMFETYFKYECLIEEWESNGWRIELGAEASDTEVAKSRELYSRINEGIIRSQSRALRAAKGVRADGTNLSPFAKVRNAKAILDEKIGKDYLLLQDEHWFGSWVIAPGNSKGVEGARLQSLYEIAKTDPQLWTTIQYVDALRTLAIASEVGGELPKLPVTPKEIATVKILADCPHLEAILSGELGVWDSLTEEVLEAADYLRQHNLALARLSKHNQLINGFRFTEKTPAVECVRRALRIMGKELASHGRITNPRRGGPKQVSTFSIQTAQDVEDRITRIINDKDGDKALAVLRSLKTRDPEKYREKIKTHPRLYRELVRAETSEDLTEQIKEHIQTNQKSCLSAWRGLVNRLTREEVERVQIMSGSFITDPFLRSEITYFLNAILGEVGADGAGRVLSAKTREAGHRALERELDAQKERILAIQDLLAA